MQYQQSHTTAAFSPQLQAFHGVGQPVPPPAPPALPLGTTVPLPGFVPWTNTPQQLTHWAASHPGVILLWAPQAYHWAPWAPLPYSSPLFCQPTSHLGTPPPPPLAPKPHWRPPLEPQVSFPEEVCRDDDQENDWEDDSDDALDLQKAVDSIHHWASLAGRLCEKEPSIAQSLQMPLLLEVMRTFLYDLLRPNLIHNEDLLAHARRYVPYLLPSGPQLESRCIVSLNVWKYHRKFLCWVMLDFCQLESDLTDQVITRGCILARKYGSLRHFENLLIEELKVTPSHLKALKGRTVTPLADDEGL